MDPDAIIQYIRDTFPDVEVFTATEGLPAGDTFFMYDPDQRLDPQHRFPFATIGTKDYGEFDRASSLDRAGVFRLNVGVSRKPIARCSVPSRPLPPRAAWWARATTSPPSTNCCRTPSMRRSPGSACSTPAPRRSRP